tara:strand:- start:3674 stop:4234 length:561 start_codon:yes stop_codon:yes gene_type:complete
MIHISHPKKDLIEIIELFELYDIEDYRDLAKADLSKELWKYLTKSKIQIQPDNDYYFVQDVNDLLEYLKRPNERQITSNAVRYDVTDRVRNIIFYCHQCEYYITSSNYDCMDDIIQDAIFIANYGNMPSVRRALRLLNKDDKLTNKIEPVISRKVKKRLEKEIINKKKKKQIPLLKSDGNFILVFD